MASLKTAFALTLSALLLLGGFAGDALAQGAGRDAIADPPQRQLMPRPGENPSIGGVVQERIDHSKIVLPSYDSGGARATAPGGAGQHAAGGSRLEGVLSQRSDNIVLQRELAHSDDGSFASLVFQAILATAAAFALVWMFIGAFASRRAAQDAARK